MRKMKEHNKTLRLLRKLRRFSGDKIYAVLSERLIHPYLSDMRTELKALNEFQEIANLEGETLRKAIEEFMQEF